MQGIKMRNTHWFQEALISINFEWLCRLPHIKLISWEAMQKQVTCVLSWFSNFLQEETSP